MNNEIVERLRRWYHDYHDRRHELGDRHCQGSCQLVVANLMRVLQPEIERLLADERERVREDCCRATCMFCRGEVSEVPALVERDGRGQWQHRCEDGTTCICCAHHIRQLDLTKDLAASNREERDWLPMYHYGCSECKAHHFNPEKIPHTASCRNQHKSEHQQVTRVDEGEK